MTNRLVNALKQENNKTQTTNRANAYRSTLDALLDLFSQGAAYRNRSDADCINLFMKAFKEDEEHAMKCLFYIRDVRGGKLVA